jgi:hypothetical protein
MSTITTNLLMDGSESKLRQHPQRMMDNTKLSDIQQRMKGNVKLSDLQQRMKDNVKLSDLQQAKLSELQHRMKDNAAKIAGEVVSVCEKIKESDTLNGMIKESTLDKLLVGRGTLDRLLAEEEAEWQPAYIESAGSAEEKENKAPTTEHLMQGQDSYMQKGSSYLKALGQAGGNTIAGIGSTPAIADMRLAQYFNAENFGQLGEFANGASEAVLEMMKDPLARNVDIPLAQHHLAKQTGGEWTMASNRGWNSVSPSAVVEPGDGGGDYERKLILELCPPGGMKAEPPTEKLEEFALVIPSLSSEAVCLALLDVLEDGNPWVMRAKALCVIEAILKLEAERITGGGDKVPYADYFRRCIELFEDLATHVRESVNGPAKKVLVALGHIALESLPFNDPEANHIAAVAPPSQVASSVATTGGERTSMFSGLNTQMKQMQQVYEQNKKKMQFQQTHFQAPGGITVPSYSAWNLIPVKSTVHEKELNAL